MAEHPWTQQLQEWARRHGVSQRGLARLQVGSRAAVQRWLRGECLPDEDAQQRVDEASGGEVPSLARAYGEWREYRALKARHVELAIAMARGAMTADERAELARLRARLDEFNRAWGDG